MGMKNDSPMGMGTGMGMRLINGDGDGKKPNPSKSPNPVFYKYLPDDDEIIRVLDKGGYDSVDYNKVCKRDVYSNHIWKVLEDLSSVVFNSMEYIEQAGSKSCVTDKDELGLGEKTSYIYGIRNSSLKTEGEHKTSWRMTKYVSDKGDKMTAMCGIRNVNKGVIFVAVANRKAYAAFRRAHNKYVTGVWLLESRKLKVEETESQKEESKKKLDTVEGGFRTAEIDLKKALVNVTVEYKGKAFDVLSDMWIRQEEDDHPHEQSSRLPFPIRILSSASLFYAPRRLEEGIPNDIDIAGFLTQTHPVLISNTGLRSRLLLKSFPGLDSPSNFMFPPFNLASISLDHVEQLHKIFKLCGTLPNEFWKKSQLPLAAMFRPQYVYEITLRERYQLWVGRVIVRLLVESRCRIGQQLFVVPDND
ncbi:hypothetical protein Tco_1290368 [Tanacetum coccineum]